MSSKLLKITLTIVAVIIIALGYLYLTGKIKINNTAEEIAGTNDFPANKNMDNVATEEIFCRKNYMAEVLKIDDVDVIKRIIEIWEKREGKCEFNITGDNIGVAKKVSADGKIYNIVIYDKDDKEQSRDPFNQSVEQFEINLNNNTVSYQLQLDGSFFEIGQFKFTK